MNRDGLAKLLGAVRDRRVGVERALAALGDWPMADLGFARVDHQREVRCGLPEVLYAAGKTPAQAAAIAREIVARSGRLLATRVDAACARALRRAVRGAKRHEAARCVTVGELAAEVGERDVAGGVLVVSAGTSDLPVAEEAAVSARFAGAAVAKVHDVGVAGLHRVLGHREALRRAGAVVVVAGMEGALPSVVGGLTDRPVVAVPTSVGYGASLGGLAALLAMLNSCAAGVGVVNIDNGFGAGVLAARIARGSTPRRRG